MATELNAFELDKEDIIAKANARGESEFLIGKRKEAVEQFDSLEMIKPDKTKVDKWDFFNVTSPVVEGSTFNTLEELPEGVKELIDLDKVENIYVQHNNTPAYLQLNEDLNNKGFIVENIIDASQNHPELLEQYFMTDGVKLDENKLTAYHAALLNGGVFIYVPKDVKIEEPIQSVVLDRKSTRLNSSHVSISYAVFCLKKK